MTFADPNASAAFTPRVQTDRTMFENLDKKLPIMSGMQAQVDSVLSCRRKPASSVFHRKCRLRRSVSNHAKESASTGQRSGGING